MRKVIVSEFVSLNGVMEAPEKWSFPYWNEEIGKLKFDELFASDALLLGRVTYQIFAKAWPSLTDEANRKRVKEVGGEVGAVPRGNPFADRMNSIRKLVVSKTLLSSQRPGGIIHPYWNNSKLIKENVVEEVSKLKKQPGQNILIAGSGELVHTLMKHDLIDEYWLLVYPVILGKGKRIFKDGIDRALKLVQTKAFDSGVVLLRYRPDKKHPGKAKLT